MKLHDKTRYIDASEYPDGSRQFEIEAGAKAFQLLLDKIYTDKPLAAVREAAQNAYDAHLEAGVTDPIVVRCPTHVSPELYIEDYGAGMSHDFMLNQYCRVTHSTKTATNTSVGGLGIGRLSMLAICDTYHIISRHNGTEWQYLVYLNEERIPSIIPVQQNPTTRTGVKVKIPIERDLISKINLAARYALGDFPENTVTLINADLTPTKYLWRTEHFGIRQPGSLVYGYHRQRILMGPMGYPIDANITNDIMPQKLKDISRLDIFAGIGDVEVAPSREGLDYTKRSMTKLKEFFEQTARNIDKHVQSFIDEQPTNMAKYFAIIRLAGSGLYNYSSKNEALAKLNMGQVREGVRYGYDNPKYKNRLDWDDSPRFTDSSLIPMIKESTPDLETEEVCFLRDNSLVSVFALLRHNKAKARLDQYKVIFVVRGTASNPQLWEEIKREYEGASFREVSELPDIHHAPDVHDLETDPPVKRIRAYPPLKHYISKRECNLKEIQEEYDTAPHRYCWFKTSFNAPLNIDLPEDVDNQEAYIKKVDHYLFQEAWPDPYGKMIIAVPTSHKPALRWVEQAMPHFNDVCVSAAVRAWNSRSLRNAIMLVPLFEQYLAMKQNLIAESEFTVALWRFLIITNRAGCKAVSENEELEHTPIAQVYRLAAHLKDHIDIRSPDLVSARQLIAYYLPSIDRRQFYQAAELTMQKFKLLQSDIINRYPLIADMLAHVNKQFEGQNRSSYSYYNWRYELPTLPTQVLLNYIKFIEDLNNERHHPQKRFSLVDCRLVNSGDRWPRLSGTGRPPELAGDPEGDHRRGLRQSN